MAGVVAAAIVGTVMDEHGPKVAERFAGVEPFNAFVGADGAAHSDGWTLFMPGELGAGDQPRFEERPTAEESPS
jgi:hypothetical protein